MVSTKPLRADACRNRDRIVLAAREAVVEEGPEVPFDVVAHRAGVGNATLYRHFPDRQALLSTVVAAVLERTAAAAEAAEREEADPFAAIRRFAHAAADERIGALCPLLSAELVPDSPELADARGRLEAALGRAATRAREAGLLREDVGYGDLMLSLTQLARPVPGTRLETADRFVHRHLDILLDGLRAPAHTPLTGHPVTLDELRNDCEHSA